MFALLMIFLWHIMFVCYIGSEYVGGHCGVSESKLCPVGSLVVCKCS